MTEKPKAQLRATSDSSIFDSIAYKEFQQGTSLGPNHSAIALLTREEGTKACDDYRPPPSQLKMYKRAGRPTFPPKPPDISKPTKALHIHPITRFKISKAKPKEPFGGLSEGLNKALAEALGHPISSDEEMSFTKANSSGFDDESASDKSEREL